MKRLVIAAIVVSGGCAGPDEPQTGSGDSNAATEDTGSVDTTHPQGEDTGDDGGDVPADDGDDGHAPGDVLFSEDFDGPDGEPWPAPWTPLGGVTVHDLDEGRGRLEGPPQTVARMGVRDLEALDVDVLATVQFADFSRQGLGIYVRQNGGWLVNTDPPGQGYAIYVEGGFEGELGLWREHGGVEEQLGGVPVEGGIAAMVPYHVRLQCIQQGNATLLRTKMWAADDDEPNAWAVELVDITPDMQDVPGGLAIDVYNYEGTQSVFVDDIVVRAPG